MNELNDKHEHHYVWMGIPIGVGFGVALGVVMMKVFDHPGFFALGIAIGLSIGTTIAVALDQRDHHDL